MRGGRGLGLEGLGGWGWEWDGEWGVGKEMRWLMMLGGEVDAWYLVFDI